MYNKNNNSIFNISACLINNQSKLYLVYNVFNLSNHTILLTFEGSIIDNYFFTPNYQMEQFGPNFFVCPQVGVEPTSQTYFVWFYRWATEGCFLFGSLDDITITYSFVKVNRLIIFFSLARRVGFEPTEAFTSSVFKTDAIIHLGHLRMSYTTIELEPILSPSILWGSDTILNGRAGRSRTFIFRLWAWYAAITNTAQDRSKQ